MPLYQVTNEFQSLISEFICIVEETADPDRPGEDIVVIWQSNGVNYGNKGDIAIASTVNGVTRRKILFDFSEGDVW